jgi:hypothetical protein
MNELPARPEQSAWPEDARIAALKAVDWRCQNAGLQLTAEEAWYLVSDILNAAAPIIRAEATRRPQYTEAERQARREQRAVVRRAAAARAAQRPARAAAVVAARESLPVDLTPERRYEIATALRSKGMTLDEVGQVFGITRQGAHLLLTRGRT